MSQLYSQKDLRVCDGAEPGTSLGAEPAAAKAAAVETVPAGDEVAATAFASCMHPGVAVPGVDGNTCPTLVSRERESILHPTIKVR